MAVLQRAPAATIAVLRAIDAYVHVHEAGLYDTVTTSTLSQGTLFRAQAAAVLLYTYLDVGGAYRVYVDPGDLLQHLDEVGVRDVLPAPVDV